MEPDQASHPNTCHRDGGPKGLTWRTFFPFRLPEISAFPLACEFGEGVDVTHASAHVRLYVVYVFPRPPSPVHFVPSYLSPGNFV